MLTLQHKRQIDIVVPTVLACMAAIYAFKKGRTDWRTLLVVIIGGFVVAYILTTQVTKYIYTTGPMQLPVSADAQNYDGLPLAKRIREDAYCMFCFRNDAPYKELLSLSDGQLLQVHNAWNRNFYSEKGETLHQAIEDENGGWFLDFANIREQLLDRFQTLSI